MLEIYPIKEQEVLETYFANNGLEPVSGAAGYIAYDNGNEVGCCLFVVDKQAQLLFIAPADDMLLCDSLIRAAINYSANRGVFNIVCATKLTKEIATKLSYLLEDTDEIDVSGMMQGCKNCKKV